MKQASKCRFRVQFGIAPTEEQQGHVFLFTSEYFIVIFLLKLKLKRRVPGVHNANTQLNQVIFDTALQLRMNVVYRLPS